MKKHPHLLVQMGMIFLKNAIKIFLIGLVEKQRKIWYNELSKIIWARRII